MSVDLGLLLVSESQRKLKLAAQGLDHAGVPGECLLCDLLRVDVLDLGAVRALLARAAERKNAINPGTGRCSCATCLYSWPTGSDGSHSCEEHLVARLNSLFPSWRGQGSSAHSDLYMVVHDGASWCATFDNPVFAAAEHWHYVQGGLSSDVAEVLVYALGVGLVPDEEDGEPESLLRLRSTAQPQGAPK